MSYRVRNQHGELTFRNRAELREACRLMMVEPEDEVLDESAGAGGSWRKASSMPQLFAGLDEKPPFMRREGKWYVFAGLMVVAAVYFVVNGWDYVSIAIAALVFVVFLVWTTFASTRRR